MLTVVLLALSGWGFTRLAAESGGSALTSGEARLTASIVLNLVMFGYSLIAALGTETESGIALALLARPIRRSAFLLGKWLGLVAFGSGFVVLAVLLSTAVSPMASGVVAVGLFCTTWVAGVVGGLGEGLGNEAIAQVGTVSRMLLPTDGLWQGAMHGLQDPSVFATFGGTDVEAFPFLSSAPLTATYLVWVAAWVAMVWGLAATSFLRKDL